jgi:hypothetical protein
MNEKGEVRSKKEEVRDKKDFLLFPFSLLLELLFPFYLNYFFPFT